MILFCNEGRFENNNDTWAVIHCLFLLCIYLSRKQMDDNVHRESDVALFSEKKNNVIYVGFMQL